MVEVSFEASQSVLQLTALGRQPALATAKTGRSSRMPTRTTFDRIQHRTKCRLPVSRRLRTTAALRDRSARRRASGSGRAHRGSLFSGNSPDVHKSDVTARPPHAATGKRGVFDFCAVSTCCRLSTRSRLELQPDRGPFRRSGFERAASPSPGPTPRPAARRMAG